jgi:hypothetical protein
VSPWRLTVGKQFNTKSYPEQRFLQGGLGTVQQNRQGVPGSAWKLHSTISLSWCPQASPHCENQKPLVHGGSKVGKEEASRKYCRCCFRMKHRLGGGMGELGEE